MSEYVWLKDELYHHGVQGQKWGIRKYQNKDGSLTAEGRIHYGYGAGLDKISSSGAKLASDSRSAARIRKYGRIGSSIANRVGTAANTAQRNAESLKKIHESDASTFKKVLKSASYMALPAKFTSPDGKTSIKLLKGSGFKANENKALADQARTSESYRSTKTGRYLASIAAKNYDSFAKYYENRAESDSVKEYLKNTLKIFNTPTTRLTGKQTTVGREAVRFLLTAGIAQGVDLGRVVIGKKGVRKYDDSAYKQAVKDAKSRKNEIAYAKKERIRKDREIQDKYFKQIEDLERGYKKGQNLSDEDQKKELLYDDAARKAWDYNEKLYKQQIKAINAKYK